MSARVLLVALILAATAAFVVGTAIERNTGGESGHHDAVAKVAPATAEAAGNVAPTEAGGESAAAHANETGTGSAASGGESAATHAKETDTGSAAAAGEASHAEFRPLGMNIESWSFVMLATLLSLGLALAVWLRPQVVWLLAFVALAMAAFAALDVNEVVHQLDVNRDGLAALAAGIALLHLAAAAVGAMMASSAWRRRPGAPGAGGTMPA